jgi:formylglycine-generating enzyme required for sulfatase activity
MTADLMHNPPRPDEADSPFFGRDEVFAWIAEHLAHTSPTQPLILYGPPAIGKTAVLRQIMSGKLGRDVVPIYVDFEHLLHESLSIFLGDLAKTAVLHLKSLGYTLNLPDQTNFVINPYTAFKDEFLRPALEQLSGKKLLLLCDNLNVLLDGIQDGAFDAQTLEAFYRLIHAHPGAYTLFALNYPETAGKYDALSLVESIPQYQIDALGQEEAIAMIRQTEGVTIFRDAAEYIARLTGGHPAEIIRFCQALQRHQEAQKLRHVTVADAAIVGKTWKPAAPAAGKPVPQAPAFKIIHDAPRERTDYRLPDEKSGPPRGLLFAFGVLLLLTMVIIAAFIFRAPIRQQFAGNQPPVSETAVFLTSEAIAAAIIAATPSPTETAVPPTITATSSPTPSQTPTITPTPSLTPSPTQTPTPAKPSELLKRENDGMPMRYIPGGTFLMGSLDEDFTAAPDEKPQHEVRLDPYYLDQFEVNVAQYAAFLNRIGTYKGACSENDCVHPRPEAGFTSYLLEEELEDGKIHYIPLTGYADYPINHVTWYGAQAYCEAMGARLPSEAEWEFAARSDDGRIYPWGNEAPDETRAVFNSDSYENLKPVDALPDGNSPFNIFGMAGSLWEWTNDWYDEDYYESSPASNPKGPETGLTRVIRGGAWPNNNLADRIRSANRSNFTPDFISATVGFRCAQDP